VSALRCDIRGCGAVLAPRKPHTEAARKRALDGGRRRTRRGCLAPTLACELTGWRLPPLSWPGLARPPTSLFVQAKSWMAGPTPAMTEGGGPSPAMLSVAVDAAHEAVIFNHTPSKQGLANVSRAKTRGPTPVPRHLCHDSVPSGTLPQGREAAGSVVLFTQADRRTGASASSKPARGVPGRRQPDGPH
jgi:hypothetical protein